MNTDSLMLSRTDTPLAAALVVMDNGTGTAFDHAHVEDGDTTGSYDLVLTTTKPVNLPEPKVTSSPGVTLVSFTLSDIGVYIGLSDGPWAAQVVATGGRGHRVCFVPVD